MMTYDCFHPMKSQPQSSSMSIKVFEARRRSAIWCRPPLLPWWEQCCHDSDCRIGKITVYGIPEKLFWKTRNSLLIYHTWYKRDFRKNTEISAMRAVPKPHQPPHLLSFGISMFVYQKENNTVQITINFLIETLMKNRFVCTFINCYVSSPDIANLIVFVFPDNPSMENS